MNAVAPAATPFWRGFGIHKGELCVAVGVILTLLVMIFPLPRLLLDLLLSFNLTFSLMVLLLSLYTIKPIEFFIFPSLLLVTTLFPQAKVSRSFNNLAKRLWNLSAPIETGSNIKFFWRRLLRYQF